MLICDTSALIAFFDASDAQHERVAAAIASDPGPFVVSPFVVAELDFLLATRRGVAADLVALQEIAGGAWDLPACDSADVRMMRDLIERYQDQDIGIADASLVLLAERYGTDRILTLDRRHLHVLRPLEAGHRFTLLPT
jgi:predicted nucleic acid-binding protein